jgi:hypothetical protein
MSAPVKRPPESKTVRIPAVTMSELVYPKKKDN